VSFRKIEDSGPKKCGVGNSEPREPVNPADVFAELCALLEEFSPAWYTEEQRDRALAAVRNLPRILDQTRRNSTSYPMSKWRQPESVMPTSGTREVLPSTRVSRRGRGGS
jgi:hypothetical protein